jgi:hypothetical protein
MQKLLLIAALLAGGYYAFNEYAPGGTSFRSTGGGSPIRASGAPRSVASGAVAGAAKIGN